MPVVVDALTVLSSAMAPSWDINRIERYLARMHGFAPLVGKAVGVPH